MKQKLSIAAAAVISVLLLASSIGVAAAQDGADDTESEPLVKVLKVDVPGDTRAGEPVTITVTDRHAGTPVEGAAVYAFGWPLRNATDVAADRFARNTFWLSLGDTDINGEVTHTFENAGRVLIVATADDYIPGLARLTLRPDISGRLKVEAPDRVEVEQSFTFTVVEKGSGDGVPRADVWVVERPPRLRFPGDVDCIEDLRSLLNEAREMSAEDIMSRHGQHVGQTDDDGNLTHAFGSPGRFLLVATKSDYVPGVKTIGVVVNKALTIDAPWRTDVGEDFTITVKTRGTVEPVEGADLYALTPGTGSSVAKLLPRIREEAETLTEIVERIGEHIGTTNESGEVEHRFSSEGLYLVIGVKDGYIPGFTTVLAGDVLGIRRLVPRFNELDTFAPRLHEFRQALPELDGLSRLRSRIEDSESLWPGMGQLRERIGENGSGE